MDSAPSPNPTPVPPPRRRLNPLAIVLIISVGASCLFMAVSGVVYLARRGSASQSAKPGHHAAILFGSGDVGIIELKGVIMDSKKTVKALKEFEDDDDVRAVVLRLDSPGGAVAPSQEIYQEVHDFRKPLVVSMGSVAASGAYYIACGAKKIFANPGTITGSIGVIMEFTDLEKLLDWAKVKMYAVKTGRFKDMGAPYREMTPDEHALLQGMVDDVLSQFVHAVSVGRSIDADTVMKIADGRIFSGHQAKENHLVDQLGTLHDAVDEAGKLAGLKGEPTVVYPSRKHRGLIDILQDVDDRDEASDSDSSYSGPGVVNVLRGLIERGLGLAKGSASDGSAAGAGALLPPGIYWLWRGGY